MTSPQYNGAPQGQWQPGMPVPPPQFHVPKKRRVWPWLLVLGIFGLCGAGFIVSLSGSDTKDAAATVPSIAATKAKATPKRSASPDMIQEGTWIVGSDVKAGKYQTLGASDSTIPLCYWDVRDDSEAGQIVAQGVKDKTSAKGYVTLKKGQYFTTSGCSDWTMVTSAENLTWSASKLSSRKVYVIETLPSSWPVTSAQVFVDRYTGSNWVMASKCPSGAYRCIWVKKANLSAPVIASTYNYNSSRVTIKVDTAYASSRGYTSYSKRKNILAHEFGHAGFIRAHSSHCGNLMYAHANCIGWSLTKNQKAILARH